MDLALIGLLMAILMLMILPIPTWLMDTLIAFNMAFAILILMVAVYLKSPLEFSTFPSIILFSTVFRIALSVASTRLILIDGDAGEIIETFGNFVVQGNVIVGLIIFLVISTVQFLVITKGAERIAEVSARFTLDAMPGKQMSIEAEIRSGELKRDAGRHKRNALSQESQFFGSMDGAMKFVKGDAIAGIIIILINLVGGISLGVAQKGMSFSEAMHTYSLLTVGDGLVAQIPALFIALCAGAVVTRVTSEAPQDLGTEMVAQLLAQRRGLVVAACIVAALGLMPGFPTAIFFLLGLSMAIVAAYLPALKSVVAPDSKEEADDSAFEGKENDRLALHLSAADLAALDTAAFVLARKEGRARFLERHGYELPTAGLRADPLQSNGSFRIVLDGVPIIFGHLRASGAFVVGDENMIALSLGIPAVVSTRMPQGPGVWVDTGKTALLQSIDIRVSSAAEAIWTAMQHAITARLGLLLTTSNLEAYLADLNPREAALREQIHENIDDTIVTEVLRRLAAEATPLVPRYAVLMAIADWSVREQDPVLLAEYTRQGIKRQICHHYSTGQNAVSTYLIDNSLDEKLREAVQKTDVGGYLALGMRDSAAILETFSQIDANVRGIACPPVIVAANDIRRYLRRFLSENDIYLPVIAQQELSGEFQYKPLGVLRANM
ncbi:flagellar biosynthesis protein FlhA [Tabrizicola aquatica]|uniref:flagellar biosynthesis protein FlhA n=1 Tax=Tabrizicola aquatica TaxID=909926 RepID=UPI0015E1B972|nr:flagellar biosynthesis protein FlhA [Tabrizicola aquatica]